MSDIRAEALRLIGSPGLDGPSNRLARTPGWAGRLSRFWAGVTGLPALRRALALARAEATVTREWLRMTEQMAQVGHWRILLPGHEVHWSDEIYRIHGLRRESFAPDIETALAAFHPEDRPMVEQRIAETVANKTPYEVEARIIRADGDIRHILSRGMLQYGADGVPVALLGVIIDISKQKLVEADLRKINFAKKQANEALRVLAFVDGLTGLRNRRFFDETLAAEFHRAEQDGTTLGLIMVDLDHFKAYNDRYGHPAGDECLQNVAATIAAVPQRPGDLVARYGGEEIVLLLPGMDGPGLAAMATRIVQSVWDLNLPHRGNPHARVTISCGAALRGPSDVWMQPLALLRLADKALYDAKHKGRNSTCVLAGARSAAAQLTHAGH